MNIRLAATALVSLLVCAGFRSAHAAQPVITVGKNVQASAVHSRVFHGEIQLAADPDNANHLLACSMFGLNGDATFTPRTVIAYVSVDRGKSWRPTIEMPGHMGEPSCALGPGGHAYVGALSGDLMGYEGVMHGPWAYVDTSSDGGQTWTKALTYRSKLGEFDREYFNIDSVSNRYRGRVYFHLFDFKSDPNSFSGVLKVLHSDDYGKVFSPAVIADPKAEGAQAGPSAILGDGTLMVESARIDSQRVVVSVSQDGGRTFQNHTVLSKQGGIGLNPIAADTSHGPFRNRAYVVWEGMIANHYHIWLSHSDDKGETWSPPSIVDDNATGENGAVKVSRPQIAVNRNGIVAVLWLDQRGISDGVGFNARFAASNDGGLTFSPSVRVSDSPNLLEPGNILYFDDQTYGGGKRSDNYPIGLLEHYHHGVPLIGAIGSETRFGTSSGDIIGFVADAQGEFHAMWTGNSTGVPQLWTAPIDTDAVALRNGDASLASFTDVTSRAELNFYHPVYNRTTGILTVGAAITNASHAPLQWPIAIRITALRSRVGTPIPQAADNGESGLGAIWEFQSEGGSRTLMPGERTPIRTLTFRIENAHASRKIGSDALSDYLATPVANYLTIEAHAYAHEKLGMPQSSRL